MSDKPEVVGRVLIEYSNGKAFRHEVEGQIPVTEFVTFLEILKQSLIAESVAVLLMQKQASQQRKVQVAGGPVRSPFSH